MALWVACNEAHERDGAVYVLSRSATEEISNSRDLEKKIQSFYEEGILWSWEPSPRGNRIVAQSSVLAANPVFGVPVGGVQFVDATSALMVRNKQAIFSAQVWRYCS